MEDRTSACAKGNVREEEEEEEGEGEEGEEEEGEGEGEEGEEGEEEEGEEEEAHVAQNRSRLVGRRTPEPSLASGR
jgi:hypothetical protein